MRYEIEIDRRALKFIQKQPHSQRVRIMAAIYKLPELGDIKPLKGTDGALRLRVGHYRVVYEVDNGRLIVHVIDAGNRGDVYKGY